MAAGPRGSLYRRYAPCPTGQDLCPADSDRGTPAECADLQTSWRHCGKCNAFKCEPAEECFSGACRQATFTCSGGLSPCDGTCVDFQTSSVHCGACLNSCDNGGTCTAGRCPSTGGES
ncbi:hypothetical protein DFJ74DRAFT_673630 [Hyaloraphidium curvatum]|nr:hypothetical protein DFJ74DRAFT_673630 [Hyaloraphidium curvatum]